MYLSKRQQEVLTLMARDERAAVEAADKVLKARGVKVEATGRASLWSVRKGRGLNISVPDVEYVSAVGYRTAYVLEGLGLIASCIDTDGTVGYQLTDRGHVLVGLLNDGCGDGFTLASAS